MRALVTGGAGFLGSHIVDHLLKAGHEVGVIDDLSGGFRENLNPFARFFEGSIIDSNFVDEVFGNRFDYVFHCAAYAAEGLSHFIRRFNYTNNLIGSVNLINASVKHDVKCFVFTSSIAVYGSQQIPFTEDMTPQPEDPYGIAKYAVEMDLKAAHEMFGLNYIIFRPHNVYGERQNIADPYRNVVGIFMKQILEGKPITIFGDGRQTRCFTYIDDVAPIIAKSIGEKKAYNETFNIGSELLYTVNELAAYVIDVMGGPAVPFIHLPARNEVQHASSHHQKIGLYFGNFKTFGIRTGLIRTALWVRENRWQASRTFDNIEVERNMPESWRKLCLVST